MTSPGSDRRLLAVSVVFVLCAVGCTSTLGSSHGHVRRGIVVASFNFPESVLLADIYARALRAGGYRVSVVRDAGPREIVDPALARGIVDLVPEYSGSALLFFDLGAAHPAATLARVLAPSGLVPLAPAPAQDANTFVVTKKTARTYGLRRVSDLAPVAVRLVFGGPAECPDRYECLKGLRSIYGLRFKEFFPLDTGGPLTRQALLAGEIDVGLLFTTDPAIRTDHLVQLIDDRRLQPSENVVPVLRQTIVSRYGPNLKNLIDRVSARLGTRTLRALDARVALGEAPHRVASAWLASQQFIRS